MEMLITIVLIVVVLFVWAVLYNEHIERVEWKLEVARRKEKNARERQKVLLRARRYIKTELAPSLPRGVCSAEIVDVIQQENEDGLELQIVMHVASWPEGQQSLVWPLQLESKSDHRQNEDRCTLHSVCKHTRLAWPLTDDELLIGKSLSIFNDRAPSHVEFSP